MNETVEAGNWPWWGSESGVIPSDQWAKVEMGTSTPRGVWRLDSGIWTLDGLSTQTVSSIVVADTIYAADGQQVWRRGADGSWTAEAIPAALSQPSLLATDGNSVWAGGLGVAERISGTWTPLSDPGGLVTAMAVVSGNLVVGLRGGASQYSGAAVTSISTGLSALETVQALALANGTLFAGTDQTLYSFSGAWSAVTGFGAHDVRGITGTPLHLPGGVRRPPPGPEPAQPEQPGPAAGQPGRGDGVSSRIIRAHRTHDTCDAHGISRGAERSATAPGRAGSPRPRR